MKKALILGANSQDGSYLIEHLLERGYNVIGAVRRSSVNNLVRIAHLLDKIILDYFDIADSFSIYRVIQDHSPSMIFNLAAQSFVGVSFLIPNYTAAVDGLGVLNVLEAVKNIDPQIKVYQASTSELYGGDIDNMPITGFNEESKMIPKSPYAAAKLYALEMCGIYRQSYGMFVSNGILFNHTSPRRGDEFVEKKIINAFLNKHARLKLGRSDTLRDFGHARDYTRAMIDILETNSPDNYVVSTGSMLSPQMIVDICKSEFEFHPEIEWNCPEFTRRNEVNILLGDSSKIRRKLGWRPDLNTAEDVILSVIKELKKSC